MKKLLVFLALFGVSLGAQAQNKARPIAKISYGPSSYSVVVGAPAGYYAKTASGKRAMEIAVASGVWSLTTLDGGCVIPAGSVPPATKPDCSCQLAVSVSSPTVGCGASVQLTANATGSSASGASFAWTGPNGYTASGASIAITAAQSDGAYPYTVTASKGSCSASATSTVTVTGCQSTTQTSDALFSYQVPQNDTQWDSFSSQPIGFQNIPIGNYDILENEFLRVEIRSGFGGLVQVKDKVTGRYLINSPDQGRGDGPSSYTQKDYTNNVNWVDPATGQHPFTYNGANPAPGPWFTGYNPLSNGDWGGSPATIRRHSRITINGLNYVYLDKQLNSWSHNTNYKERMFEERWIALDQKKVYIHTRLTHDRTDLTDYGPYLQEWRLSMINGNQFNAVWYNGNNPYTYGGVTRSLGVENGVAVNNREFPVSEPWIGVEIDQNNRNRVIAHYAPDMWTPSYEHMDPQEGSDCDGCREGIYISGHVLANLDAKGVWLFHDTYIVGDINSDVRPYVYAQPKPGVPVWNFNAATQRAGWAGFNGVNDLQLPNAATNAGWSITWNGKTDNGQTNIDNSFLISPRTAFKASDCPTLYVTTSSTNTNQTSWRVKYSYVGQDRESLHSGFPTNNALRFPYNPQTPSAGQQVPFTMTNDNQNRTYAIPMNWNANSYISTVELWPNGGPGTAGAKWAVSRIGCTAP